MSPGTLKTGTFFHYVENRKIKLHFACEHCREVQFAIGSKQYLAIGFENRSGGFELRNRWFKGSSSPKDVSFISSGSLSICILEGFMDFLSLLTLNQIILFLDNDLAGREAKETLTLKGVKFKNAASLYAPYKDVNEYLTKLKCDGLTSPRSKGLRR